MYKWSFPSFLPFFLFQRYFPKKKPFPLTDECDKENLPLKKLGPIPKTGDDDEIVIRKSTRHYGRGGGWWVEEEEEEEEEDDDVEGEAGRTGRRGGEKGKTKF